MSEMGGEKPAGPSYADRILELAAAADASSATVVRPGGWKDPAELGFEKVPPKPIRKREVSEEQARNLAMTRRKRFSEFWGGAWLATIPGASSTLIQIDWHHIALPSDGHAVEVALFFVTGALCWHSLLDFREPTSNELFKELFPETPQKASIGARIGMFFSDLKTGFRSLQ
ncbi:MAG TPA: hypothetical protein VJ753_05860 [Rhizomicrobium sp.]|nr:hypothetical protein [Rhizomicrobium sp.]